MRPVLITFPAPTWPVILIILALLLAGLGGWLLWLRQRRAATTEHLYTAIAVFAISTLLLTVVRQVLQLDEIRINSYGATLMLGFLVGIFTAIRLGLRRAVSADRLLDLGLVVLVGAVIGARVGYVLITPGEPLLNLSYVLKNGLGGLSFHGGLIGGILVGSIFIFVNRLQYWRVVDCNAPGIAVGYAITRIGCFLNACCYGKPAADLPWAVKFPHPHDAFIQNVPLHPTQLYASLMGFAIFGILLLLSRGQSLYRAGRLFMALLVLEGIERYVMEIYRWPDPNFHGTVTPAQFVSMIIVLVGIIGWFLLPKNPAVVTVSPPTGKAVTGS